MARRRRNVVLLYTDSKDSLFKRAAYTAAANRLGLEVRGYPDAATLGVVTTSDSRALDAAWMCRAARLAGPDPQAVAIATSKSLTYARLAAAGFELLPWIVPSDERDLSRTLGGPVIVKPDSGSGSVGKAPWAYRVFDDVRDFRRYLDAGKLMSRFIGMQRSGEERHLVMRYVESPHIHSIATVAGDREPVLYDTNAMTTLPGSKVIGTLLIGARHRGTPDAVRMAAALARLGLRRSVIYIQCMAHRGRLYPIDLNLRPGAMWSLAAAGMTNAFDELLGVLLGMKARAAIRWPAPFVGVAKLQAVPRAAGYRAEFPSGAVPLIAEVRRRSRKYYDTGHDLPILAIPCARERDFTPRLRQAIAETRFVHLQSRRRGR